MAYLDFADRGYVLLRDIDHHDIPMTLSIDGFKLKRKNEFHMTLVGARAVKAMTGGEICTQQLRDAVNDFAKYHNLTDYTETNEYRVVSRDDRMTVIQMIKAPYINELFAQLNAYFQVSVPVQPTHLTLYSLDPIGISVNSQQDLEENTRIISLQ